MASKGLSQPRKLVPSSEGESATSLCNLNFGNMACFMTVSRPRGEAARKEKAALESHELVMQDPALSHAESEFLRGKTPVMNVHAMAEALEKPSRGAPAKSSPRCFPTISSGGSLSILSGSSLEAAPHMEVGGSSSSTSTGCALQAAYRSGRWIEANRQIKALEMDGKIVADFLDEASVERVRRVEHSFAESLSVLVPTSAAGWLEGEDPQNGFEFAHRLIDGIFQVRACTVLEGIDAITAFIGLCEFHLVEEYLPGVARAHLLLQKVPNDSVWHVQTNPQRGLCGKEDNILHVSAVDALDEPLAALWFSAYTPAATSLKELQRLAFLPASCEGSVRSSLQRRCFAVTPLSNGVKITMSLCRRPSSASFIFPEFVRREVSGLLLAFKSFLGSQTLTILASATASTEKMGFYDAVKRHLAQLQRPAAWPSESQLQRYTFKDLSELLPEDWADAD